MVFLKKNLLMMLLMVVGSFVFLGAGSATAESKIVFSDGMVGDIFVMNSDGSGLTNISNNAFIENLPSWSPDGTQIAFASNREGPAGDIYVMDADGSNVTRLTTTGLIPSGHCTSCQLEWSPELPSNLASVSTFGQFLIVFMLGGISAVWMTRRNSRMANE